MSENVGKEAAGKMKKPGRKVETPAQKLERLERDLVLARKAVAEARQKRSATVGEAVLAEAEENAEFKQQLHQLLRARVTTRAGKEAVASLLENG